MTDALRKRVRDVHARAAVRSWEYRQRHHAKGMWFRLRRELARTETAYVLPADVANALTEAGCELLTVGDEMVPKKRLLRVSRRALSPYVDQLVEAPVALQGALLAAEALALVPFEEEPEGSPFGSPRPDSPLG